MSFSVMPSEDRLSRSQVDSLDTDILVRPKSDLQSLLLDAGADKEVFTMKEVLFYLGQYIMQKQLYDQNQQHIVHCAQDALGKVLGVDSFSIKEPRGLFAMITKNLTIVRSQDVHSTFSEQRNQSQKDSGPQKPDSDSHSSSSEKRKRRKRTNSDPAGTSLAAEQSDADDNDDGSKRHRSDSFSLTFDDSLSWCVIGGLGGDRQISEPSDAYSTESGSVLSEVCISGHGSDDCVSSLESDSDNFSVEFEVESVDSEDYSLDEDASLSGEDQIYEVTIIEDTDEDTEISEADYWRCPKCEELNPPLPRNCNRCWTLRNDWLPDSVISNSASNLKTLPPKPLASQQTLEAEDGLDVPDGKRVRSLILFSSPVQEAASLSDSQSSVYLQDSQTSSAFSQDLLTSSKPCSSSPKSVCTLFSSASHLRSSLPYSSSLPSSGLGSSLTCSIPLIQKEVSALTKDLSASAELSQSEVQCDALSEHPELEHFISMEARLPDSCLEPCVICQSQPKNGCIVHGRTGHLMACYSCARKLKRRNKLCPVCREPIESVVLTYLS